MPYAVLEKEIETLPQSAVGEVVDFVRFIKWKFAAEERAEKPASEKKDLTRENISRMLAAARSGDFAESPAAIENLRDLTKNDVW